MEGEMQQSKLGTVLFIAAVVLGLFFLRDGSLNKAAPAFSLPETDGGRIDLASYRGRPELRGKGIAVVTILLGGEGDARDFLGSNSIGLTSLYDSEGMVGRAYGVGGVPKLVLIGSDGKVKRSKSGWTDESVLRDWMDSIS